MSDFATGRVPPNDLDSEATVLSAVLLDPGVADELADTLRPEHCYSNANRLILEAVWDLVGQGKPVDMVRVAGWLRDQGKLQQVGGTEYLARVVDCTPAVANVAEHARRVREKWRLRQLIQVCHRVAAEGYGESGDVQEFIDSAEQAVFEIARIPEQTETASAHDVMVEVVRQVTAASKAGGGVTGVPTGFTELDRKTSGMHPGDLFIVAGRPGMGKSSLVRDVCRHVARTVGDTAYFSLEMPKEQVGAALLASEGRIDLGRLRGGYIRADEWQQITEAAAVIGRLPLHIDDTAALTLMALRGKARRIDAESRRAGRGGLRLLVVDYLQLMQGRREARSREQEVSELSRGLKHLAKELAVPVIGVSQLNRSVETRTTKDKRPQLSDLRECLTGDTRIIDAVTGQSLTVRDLAAGAQAVTYGLRETDYRVAVAPIARTWSTGVKAVFRLRTATGRTIRATANHPVRTIAGWTTIGSLNAGERIAVPRVLPQHVRPVNRHSADELRLLGYLISDGHYARHRSVGYVKGDPALVDDVRRIAFERFGVAAKDHPKRGTESQQIELTVPQKRPHGNPIIEWLRLIGVHGELGHEKRVPDSVFQCDNGLLGVFLGALWSGDGSVVPRKTGGWCLKFSSTSMGLLDDVMRVLTRLGVVAVLGKPGRNTKSTRDIAVISVADADAICAFAQAVELRGEKALRLRDAVQWAKCRERENAHVDRIPLPVTETVRQAAGAEGMSWAQLGYRCQGKEMSRETLAKVGATLRRPDLVAMATSDVLWDEVHSVEPDGEEEAFDVSVPGMGNFVANGIFVHNSGAIEQDADTILFIYRDEYYFGDQSQDRGIAEIIVAKQRNGPTGWIKVKFTSQWVRFDNLAGSYGDFDDRPEPEDWTSAQAAMDDELTAPPEHWSDK